MASVSTASWRKTARRPGFGKTQRRSSGPRRGRGPSAETVTRSRGHEPAPPFHQIRAALLRENGLPIAAKACRAARSVLACLWRSGFPTSSPRPWKSDWPKTPHGENRTRGFCDWRMRRESKNPPTIASLKAAGVRAVFAFKAAKCCRSLEAQTSRHQRHGSIYFRCRPIMQEYAAFV